MKKTLPFLLTGILLTAPANAAVSILIQPDAIGGTLFTITQTAPNPIVGVGASIAGYISGLDLPTGMFNVANSGPGSAIQGTFPTPLGSATEQSTSQSFSLAGLHIGDTAAWIAFAPVFTFGGQSTIQFEIDAPVPVATPISPDALNPGVHTVSSILFGNVTVTVIPEPSVFGFAACGALALFGRGRRR